MKSSYSIELYTLMIHKIIVRNADKEYRSKNFRKEKKKKKERRQAIKRDKSGGKQIKSRVIIVDIVSAMRS